MIHTKNPYNNEPIASYAPHTDAQIEACIEKAHTTFSQWRGYGMEERLVPMGALAKLLLERSRRYASLMSQEMGKPIQQAVAEVEKCVWLCDFYHENAEDFLADELIETEAGESFISYDPLGVVLGVMPWNYPFWQVLRFAVPTLLAGNTVLLKHASNVTGSALALEELFKEAGFPEAAFTTVLANHGQVAHIIAHAHVRAVSVTGSGTAGSHIAKLAGQFVKPSVMELGGNNACIVWEDADLDAHMDTMVNARMQNTGQSCIAAKRFIVTEPIYDDFVARFKEKLKNLKRGDPASEATDIGVMAREDLARELQQQVARSVEKGAVVTHGNTVEKAYYEPTLLENVRPGMPAFDEELFGPVAAVIKAKDRAESLELAANSKFGLGTMLFTRDVEAARWAIDQIPDGAFFVNDMVKSDPRLPFGGTKMSGYGRELSREGIHEFVNKKTVYLKP
ncbi:NAD-dependent succinate-semialdehyde dehydrogenase [Maribacter sp. 2307ULW6-5]|uniref:NAD-dependent succinate-semialdehyde dehydrogenase n=1 Tax=Maribacter sp. 2307ULW6-5 TaxID=3386275 RepID=UPI0039BCC066